MKVLLIYIVGIILLTLGVSVTVTTGLGYLLGGHPHGAGEWVIGLAPLLAIGLIYLLSRTK